MSTAPVSISSISTQYIIIPVSATISGVSHNPTSGVVQFAFLLSDTDYPQPGDWVTGSWDISSSNIYPYLAQCLVGPAGSITLAVGAYIIWVKIADNPEVPVFQGGILYVT